MSRKSVKTGKGKAVRPAREYGRIQKRSETTQRVSARRVTDTLKPVKPMGDESK